MQLEVSLEVTSDPWSSAGSRARISDHLVRAPFLLIGALLLSLVLFAILFPQANQDDGFADFAPRIERALNNHDWAFFQSRAISGYNPQIAAWLESARADLVDEFGNGAPRLHALSCQVASDVPPHQCRARAAVITTIQDTASGPMRDVRVLGWRKSDGEWRLVFNLTPTDAYGPGKTPNDWLTGECDTCRPHWDTRR